MTDLNDAVIGEVLDDDTMKLVTQLGMSLARRARELAEENQKLRDEVDRLRGRYSKLYIERDMLAKAVLVEGYSINTAYPDPKEPPVVTITLSEGSVCAVKMRAVNDAWEALGDAGIGRGHDSTLGAAIRALAGDTPNPEVLAVVAAMTSCGDDDVNAIARAAIEALDEHRAKMPF